MTSHNPFSHAQIVSGYEAWYHTAGLQADRQEKALLMWLLNKLPMACSILEVGCGTGHFTHWFSKLGLHAVGLDLSFPMLEQAVHLGSPICLQGNAINLPFPARAFDLIALLTTLEFLPDPPRAIAEALRVARQGLLLGVLNAQSCLGWQYKREAGPVWGVARFFSTDELKLMIQEVVGEKPRIVWRTTLWPLWPGALPLPWGGFIGMMVKLS